MCLTRGASVKPGGVGGIWGRRKTVQERTGRKRLRADFRDARRELSLDKRCPTAPSLGSGDKVVVETRWEGVLAVPLGALKPGDTMVAHIRMVFTLRDDRVIAQHNYDCYEDFAAPAP